MANSKTKIAALLASFLTSALACQAQERTGMSKPFVHVPETVSPEARKYLESLPDPSKSPHWPAPDDLPGWKRLWQELERAAEPKVQATLKRYEPVVVEQKLGGVPCLEIKPKGWKENGKVLVHLHGGAYTMYSAHSRLQSSVPAATATGLRVISVDYTRAPFAKWPKVTDELIAVLEALQKEGYRLKDIAIYGESAGGGLAAGAALKMRDKGLGMPAAIVLWSPWTDVGNRGDSMVTLKNADPAHVYEMHLKPSADAYADPKDQKHPYVSPIYGDFSKGFPPTLIQGGTKEILLSHFVRLYRAIDSADGTAVLDLYEGMPHIFQVRPEMAEAPETAAALKKMDRFLKKYLEK